MTAATEHPDVAAALHGRHFLTLTDYSADEIRYLHRPRRGAEGGQARGPRGAAARRQGDRADLREGLDAHALRVRGRRLRPGRARHVHRPERLAHGPQGDRQGHRARARAHVRRDRVPRLRRERSPTSWRSGPGVPVYNGLTDEWHPTQMLADFLTMREHLRQAVRGDRRSATSATPASTWPTATWSSGRSSAWTCASPRRSRSGRARSSSTWRTRVRRGGGRPRSRSPRTSRRRSRGCDFLLTDVWVSMGEPDEVWTRAHRAAHALPGQRADDGADRQPGRQVHALPAGLPQHRHRRSARRSTRSSGCTALEVTEEVFESPASIVFDEAENRMHTIKAVMVATLGS